MCVWGAPDRARRFSAFLQDLSERPAVIIIEDVHGADEVGKLWGCHYEAALARMDGDEPAPFQALDRLPVLSAGPLCERIRQQLATVPERRL